MFGNGVVCLVLGGFGEHIGMFLGFDNYGGGFGLVWLAIKWYVLGTKVVCFYFWCWYFGMFWLKWYFGNLFVQLGLEFICSIRFWIN